MSVRITRDTYYGPASLDQFPVDIDVSTTEDGGQVTYGYPAPKDYPATDSSDVRRRLVHMCRPRHSPGAGIVNIQAPVDLPVAGGKYLGFAVPLVNGLRESSYVYRGGIRVESVLKDDQNHPLRIRPVLYRTTARNVQADFIEAPVAARLVRYLDATTGIGVRSTIADERALHSRGEMWALGVEMVAQAHLVQIPAVVRPATSEDNAKAAGQCRKDQAKAVFDATRVALNTYRGELLDEGHNISTNWLTVTDSWPKASKTPLTVTGVNNPGAGSLLYRLPLIRRLITAAYDDGDLRRLPSWIVTLRNAASAISNSRSLKAIYLGALTDVVTDYNACLVARPVEIQTSPARLDKTPAYFPAITEVSIHFERLGDPDQWRYGAGV